MNILSCVTVLAIFIIAIISNYGITVNGFVILRNQLNDNNNNYDDVINSIQNEIENENGLKLLLRSKRSPQTVVEDVYSPQYGEGYYVFPDASGEGGRKLKRKQSNLQYRPLLTYKTLKTKRKRLFVPNLFG